MSRARGCQDSVQVLSSVLGLSMTDPTGHEITELLQAWRKGDERALDKLTPEVYRELHNAARCCMARERDGHTLQTTALINELYPWAFRLERGGLAEPRPFLRAVRAADAAHSD
jgi:hypothetical protein